MNILSICDNEDVLAMIRVVKVVINIIRIIVPILLIVSLSIDFTKAMIDGNNDSIAKASKLAISKAIAAVLIFFIPNFVNIVIKLVSDDETYKKCLSYQVERVDNETTTFAYGESNIIFMNNLK